MRFEHRRLLGANSHSCGLLRCPTQPAAIWDMRTGGLLVYALMTFWDTRSVVGTCPHKHRRRIDRCLRKGSQPRRTGQKAEGLEQGSGLSAGDVGNDDVGGVSVEVLAAPVVDGGGAGIGVSCRKLDVS